MPNAGKLVEKINDMLGINLNCYDRSLLIDYNNAIENLEADIQTKKQILSYLNDQLDTYKSEYNAKAELDSQYLKLIVEETQAMKSKNDILKAYFGLVTSEEFSINKIKCEIEDNAKQFWLKMKPFMDCSKEIEQDLDKLRELVRNLNELESQTCQVMKKNSEQNNE